MIAVLGSGSWASAIASIILEHDDLSINWWIREEEIIEGLLETQRNPLYLSEIEFDTERTNLSSDIKEVIKKSSDIIFVIPSAFLDLSLEGLSPEDFKGKKIHSAIKGLIPETGQITTDYLHDKFGISYDDMTVISGPSHAEEAAQQKLTYLTIASKNSALAQEISKSISCRFVRTTVSEDIQGIEYATVLKNIYALAAGVCKGLGYGDNLMAGPAMVVGTYKVVNAYLEEIAPTLSADENIRRLCFQRDGTLFNDFEAIFSQVFGDDCDVKRSVLEILAEGPKTCSEIAAALGVGRGGSISESLDVLAESGFVAKDEGYNPETGKPARQSRYRICDNYTRFYLKYIEPYEDDIRAGNFPFSSLSELPGWRTILGFQFENMVVNNARALFPLLHLEGQHILSAAPYALKSADPGKRGLQIDLLIQTEHTAMLVEVKNRYRIDSAIESEINEKLRRFPKRRTISLRTALVYDGELAPYVAQCGIFDMIIPFSNLLRLTP